MADKLTTVLWFDGDAEEAARFYADTFPDSALGTIFRAPSDFPGGKQGDALTVEFTVCGRAFSGLNGGDMFKLKIELRDASGDPLASWIQEGETAGAANYRANVKHPPPPATHRPAKPPAPENRS